MLTIEERTLMHKKVTALSAIAEQLTRIGNLLEVLAEKKGEQRC